MIRRPFRIVVSLMVLALLALVPDAVANAAASGKQTASAPGITPTTITLGYISNVTGVAASYFGDGVDGAEARIALQNAQGGIDGRRIKLVVEDDESNPNLNATEAQLLVSKSVFGVIAVGAFTYSGASAYQQAGVPVTGVAADGPEWGQQPNSNMFSATPPSESPFNGTYYTWDYFGRILKALGVTKFANLSISVPSGIQAAKDQLAAANRVGINTCYDNLSIPYGSVDFTATTLQIKQLGCNGVMLGAVDSQVVAFGQALKNAGITAKQVYASGYSEDVLQNAGGAAAALQGAYFTSSLDFTPPNSATRGMLNVLEKYDPHYKGGIPDGGLYDSYLGADLMIKGLQLAGLNPTRQGFISKLRKVTNYTAGGILSSPTTFAHFGTVGMLPSVQCSYVVQLKGNKYVSLNHGKPYCGTKFGVAS